MNSKKNKPFFINGGISSELIAKTISNHSSKTNIGAHNIFLGQVRGDIINGKTVREIDYSAYEEMANEKFRTMKEEAFVNFNLICTHIYHSIGKVKAGEICLFVFVSSEHREESFNACKWIVEEIKIKVPIFGKEIFEDEKYVWKENKF